jgi:uncharacterized protein YifN (PemK superfamily)
MESLTKETWAICDMIMVASHTRLSRVYGGGKSLDEKLTEADMKRIEDGIRHALRLP